MKPTNILIFNRADQLPDDGWYHIVPLGEFRVRHEGKTILQVIDDRAIAAMAKRFLEAGEKLLIDFDHFSYDPDKSSEAAGWIVEVEARSNGLFARVEWTDEGEPAITNKRYRFVSPVWMPADCEVLANNRLRPLRLDSVGLTNQPNLKGMQPLSNRSAGDPLKNSPEPKETHSMKKVLSLLSLSPEASEDSAVDALQAVMNRAAEADALKNRADAAEAKVKQLEGAQLETDADAFCEKFADHIANRDAVRAQFIANRESTEALFAGLKVEGKKPEATAPISNRQKKGDEEAVVTAEDEAKANAIRNRAHQIVKDQGISFQAAFDRAQSELG
jgi:phage I-like protein